MTSAGLRGRGRKGGLAADHTSPLRRIEEVIGNGEATHLRLECGHVVSPPSLGDVSHYLSARTPEVGKRRRCYECAAARLDEGSATGKGEPR